MIQSTFAAMLCWGIPHKSGWSGWLCSESSHAQAQSCPSSWEARGWQTRTAHSLHYPPPSARGPLLTHRCWLAGKFSCTQDMFAPAWKPLLRYVCSTHHLSTEVCDGLADCLACRLCLLLHESCYWWTTCLMQVGCCPTSCGQDSAEAKPLGNAWTILSHSSNEDQVESSESLTTLGEC